MLSTELAIDILLGHQYFLPYVHMVAVLYTVILSLFTKTFLYYSTHVSIGMQLTELCWKAHTLV